MIIYPPVSFNITMEKSPFLLGKSTISMAMASIAFCYISGIHEKTPLNTHEWNIEIWQGILISEILSIRYPYD